MLRYSGPWQMMFEALGPAHTEARAILTDHLTRFARPRHATTLDATPATPPMPPPLPPPAASTSMPPMPSPASAPPDHAHPSLECHPGGIYLDATYAIARIRPT